MDLTIAVATFGSSEWLNLAAERAVPSAKAQGVPVVQAHGRTLAEARNAALAEVRTEWVVHLDADDELEPGYVDAMAAGTADVRNPAIRQVRGGRVGEPFLARVWRHRHDCAAECLRAGNWLIVGACARTDLVRAVGGWEEWPWSEDWALWARIWKAGGTFETVPAAVYRAHVRDGSRNRIPARARRHWHEQIERAVWPEECAA